jgi:serine/threonine protein kinase
MSSEPIQHGGKLLGQGVYGCAFDPPLKCITRKTGTIKTKGGRKVGKITEVADAQIEFGISQVLQKIPNADKYFTLIEEVCSPLSRTKQTEPELKKCNPIKGQMLPSMLQVIMPFAGKPLRLVPHRTKNIQFFTFGQHLLEAGALLLIGGVVHGDLHSMNIMVDSPISAKFIDFGLSWRPEALTLANLPKLYRTFNPSINQEPPELSLINGYVGHINEQVIFDRIQEEKRTLLLLSKIYGVSPKEQIQALKRFVRGSWSFQHANWFSFYSLYWSKIDAWALGSALLTLFVDLAMDPTFEQMNEFKTKGNSALSIIKGLCQIDPSKRLDAAEALELWAPDSRILQEPAVIKWLDEQRRSRLELEKLI